jgi:hypothetical protein
MVAVVRVHVAMQNNKFVDKIYICIIILFFLQINATNSRTNMNAVPVTTPQSQAPTHTQPMFTTVAHNQLATTPTTQHPILNQLFTQHAAATSDVKSQITQKGTWTSEAIEQRMIYNQQLQQR